MWMVTPLFAGFQPQNTSDIDNALPAAASPLTLCENVSIDAWPEIFSTRAGPVEVGGVVVAGGAVVDVGVAVVAGGGGGVVVIGGTAETEGVVTTSGALLMLLEVDRPPNAIPRSTIAKSVPPPQKITGCCLVKRLNPAAGLLGGTSVIGDADAAGGDGTASGVGGTGGVGTQVDPTVGISAPQAGQKRASSTC